MTATTVDRLFGESSSVAVKAPVRAVSSIANITLSGLQTVGGVLLVEGDRVLVAAQTDSKQNGIYNASASGWTRAGDFNDNRDAGQGSKVVANASPTWGAAFAIREMTSTPDPTTGSVALELDLQANGTDIHSGRVICDAVIIPYTPYGSGGATVTATYGYRVSNGNDTRSVVSFPFALGIGLQCFAGFDTSRATCTAAAYMLAQGQGIVFDGAAGTHFISYDGTGLGFHAAGNLITRQQR